VAVVGLVLVAYGAYLIYTTIRPTVPGGFGESLTQISSTLTDISDLLTVKLVRALEGLPQKEAQHKYAESSKVVENGLAVISELSSKVSAFKTEVATFESLTHRLPTPALGKRRWICLISYSSLLPTLKLG